MEQRLGYFCRAYIGQDVQANVIARTLREAELDITRIHDTRPAVVNDTAG